MARPKIPQELIEEVHAFARYLGIDMTETDVSKLLQFAYSSLIAHALNEIRKRQQEQQK